MQKLFLLPNVIRLSGFFIEVISLLDLLLEFTNVPVTVTIYSSFLLNFALVYILLSNRYFTYFDINYPIYDQVKSLTQIAVKKKDFYYIPCYCLAAKINQKIRIL